MEREERELLFRDLSARLPYHTKIQLTEYSVLTGEKLPSETRILDYYTLGKVQAYCRGVRKDEIKPYLFPLSSMTDEQEKEFSDLYYRYHESGFIFNERYSYDRYSIKDIGFYPYYLQDWFNANHFDYRGLIKKGLAIDATGLNVYEIP